MDTPGTDSPESIASDWNDPDASDADGSPASGFPGAGERVDAGGRAAALDAQPEGNATVGDMVDTDAVDSSAHEEGPGSDEVEEQASEESVEEDD